MATKVYGLHDNLLKFEGEHEHNLKGEIPLLPENRIIIRLITESPVGNDERTLLFFTYRYDNECWRVSSFDMESLIEAGIIINELPTNWIPSKKDELGYSDTLILPDEMNLAEAHYYLPETKSWIEIGEITPPSVIDQHVDPITEEESQLDYPPTETDNSDDSWNTTTTLDENEWQPETNNEEWNTQNSEWDEKEVNEANGEENQEFFNEDTPGQDDETENLINENDTQNNEDSDLVKHNYEINEENYESKDSDEANFEEASKILEEINEEEQY